jgi:hypothetical protein
LATDLINDAAFRNLYPTITALMSANFGTGTGVRIVSSDAYLNNWGNQDSQNAYVDAWSWVNYNFQTSHTLFLGGSMGGLDSLLLMATNRIPVAGCYCYFPVTSLAEEYSLSFTSAINTAYGITGTPPDTYALLTAGFDPNLMAGNAFRGVLGRFRFTSSYADTTVPRVQNADAFVTLVSPYAGEITVLTSTGLHGDPSNFVPSDMVSHFQSWIDDDNNLEGSNGSATISGNVSLGASGVHNATVYLINTTNNLLEATVTTDSSGNWSYSRAISGDTYHATAQYASGDLEYNALSNPFLVVS